MPPPPENEIDRAEPSLLAHAHGDDTPVVTRNVGGAADQGSELALLRPAGRDQPRADVPDAPIVVAPERPAYLGPALDDPRLFLDAALKWVGGFLVLTAASPLTFVLGVPRFLWELVPDELVRAWPSLLALPLLGAWLLIVRTRRWSKAGKALAVLAGLCATALIAPLSRDVTEGLFNGLPGYFWRNSPLYLAAFGLLAAGARMASRGGAPDRARTRAALVITGVGAVLLFAFYVVPQRSEIPLVETARALFGDLSDLPTKLKVGLIANRFISLTPLLALVLCAVCLLRRRLLAPSVLYAFFIACIPLLCVMGGLRSAMSDSGLALVLGLRNAAILGGAIVALAAIVEALTSQLLLDPPAEHGEASLLWRDRLLAELALPLARSGDGAASPVVLANRDLAGIPLTADSARLIDAAHPLLRRLVVQRVRTLRAERDHFGDPAEPLPAYVARRLAGGSPVADPAGETMTPRGPLPRYAFGSAATACAAVIVALLIALRIGLAPPSARSVEWAPRAAPADVEPLFAKLLPHYVSALSWARPGKDDSLRRRELMKKRLDDARTNVLAAAAPYPELAAAVQRFADLAERYGYRPRSTQRAILEMDEAVRDAGLPYSVEPVLWTQRTGGQRDEARPWKRSAVELTPFVGIKVFRVLRVRHFDGGGERFTTAWVERLDNLNIGEGHLGRSRDDIAYALVLADEARDFARRTLVEIDGGGVRDSSAENLFARLLRDDTLDQAIAALSKRAVEALEPLRPVVVPAIFPAAATTAPSAAPATAPTTARTTAPTTTPATTPTTAPAVAATPPDPRIEALSRAIVLDTERHELEHEADAGNDVPAALYRVMPTYSDRSIRHAARELRAYVAEMASARVAAGLPNLAALTLARLLRLATARSHAGTAESFAGRVVVTGFGRALGIEGATEAAARHRVNGLAAQVATRAAADPSRIPALAATLYESLFGSRPREMKLVAEHAL